MAEKTCRFPSLTRRSFMKGAAAVAAGAGMLGTGSWLAATEAKAAETDDEIVRYCWHKGHCAGYCSLKCTVRDGRLAVLEPNDIYEDPRYSTCCVKGLSEIQNVYSPERVQTPLKRVGERGEGKFESISWDQAMDEIYENLSEIQKKYGKGSIWVCNSVEASDMDWLGNILGCVCAKEDGIDLSYGSGLDPATGYGTGYAWATNGSRDWVNSKVVLNVSSNYLESSLVQSLPFFEAKEAGTKFITVDPHFSTTAGKSDQWVPINPGTDNAFFLGLVTAVLDEELYDEEFMKAHTGFTFLVDSETGELLGNDTGQLTENEQPIIDYQVWSESAQAPVSHKTCTDPALNGTFTIDGKKYTTVFDALVENQKQYPLEWAEEVTGVPAETYTQIAREYAPGPSSISIGHGGNDKVAGCDIAGHGMALLVSLTGAIDGIAGCCKPSNTAYQEIPEGTDLIVICNTCSAIANESLGCHSVTHAFDIILNDDDFTYPDYDGEEITVQDCWRARGNHELHDAVRELLRHMNFDIVELEENRDSSRFCGTATLMPLPQTSMEFAPQQLGDHDPSLFVSHSEEDRRRLMREHVSKITTPRVVSYCTVCDKGLTLGGADSASLINLLFDTLMLPQS